MKVLHCKKFDENLPNLSILDQLCNFYKMIFDLHGQSSKLTATNFQFRFFERLLFSKKFQDVVSFVYFIDASI